MPHLILSAVVNIAQSIYQQAQKVEANEEQTKRLNERIHVIVSTVQGLSQLPNTQQFKDGLKSLERCLTEIKAFIEQFSGAHLFKKILFAGSHQEDFSKFNARLAEVLVQLNVGLSAQQLINQEQDRADEQADRLKMVSKLDEVLAQQKQTLLAIQQSQFDPKEMEAIVQRQLASMETRIRGYALTEMPKPLLPKDLQVNFYDLTFYSKQANGVLGAIYTGLWREQRVTIKFVEQINTETERNQFIREAQLMSRLHSDFITRFYGACFENNRLCFLIQHMEKGSLEDNLATLTMPERLKIAQDLARGLHYLHEQNVIHGDIKPKTVLINRHNEAKWCDFGLSQTQQMSIASLHVVSQEARWQAPESWQNHMTLTTASDVYSFGLLLWTLMTGKIPYGQCTRNTDIIELVKQGHREVIHADIPEAIAQLIQGCWAASPEKRPKSIDLVRALDVVQLRSVSPDGEALYLQARMAKDNSQEQYLLLKKAEKKGSIKALNSLGVFALGGFGGCPVDKAQAKAYFEKGAENGLARACFNLARMHEKGDGIPQNYVLALELYRKTLTTDPDNTICQEKVALLTRLLESTETQGYAAAFTKT